MKKRQAFDLLVLGFLFISVAIHAVSLLQLYPYVRSVKTADFGDGVMEVDKSCYTPGETVKIHMVFEKFYDYPTKVTFQLTDIGYKRLSDTYSIITRGPVGVLDYVYEYTIPNNTLPDEYFVEMIGVTEINPINRDTNVIQTEHFFVRDSCD